MKTIYDFKNAKGASRVFILTVFFILFGMIQSMAATRTASVSGNWSNIATWGGAAVPVDGDNVIINSGVTVTVDVNTAAVASIVINAPSASNGINISGTNVLNVTGAITMTTPTVNFHDIIDVAAGTLNAGSISIGGGSSSYLTRFCKVECTTGTINVTGNILFSNSTNSKLTINDAGTLAIGGILNSNGKVEFLSSDANEIFNGSSQTIPSYAYTNLFLEGSWNKTFTSSVTIITLSVLNGVVAELGSNSFSCDKLTLDGNGTPAGDWGSTASGATYQNPSYFGTSATGHLSVGTSSCETLINTIAGTREVCNGSGATNITFGSGNGEAPFTFTYTLNGVTQTPVTTVSGNSISISAPNTANGTFTYELVNVSDANNCSQAVTGQTATITVDPLPTAPTAGNVNTTYDGSVHYGTATALNPSLEDIVWFASAISTTPISAPSLLNVGSVSAWAASKIKATGCFSSTRTKVTVTITPKPLSITAPTIASRAYSGTKTAGAVTVGMISGLVSPDDVTATAVAADYTSANVGSYPGTVVTYTLADGINSGLAANYSLAAGSATGVVTPKALSITAPTIASKPYNGSKTAGAVTVLALNSGVCALTFNVNAKKQKRKTIGLINSLNLYIFFIV